MFCRIDAYNNLYKFLTALTKKRQTTSVNRYYIFPVNSCL